MLLFEVCGHRSLEHKSQEGRKPSCRVLSGWLFGEATRRLAWLRHVETLSASVGAALWLASHSVTLSGHSATSLGCSTKAGFWPSLPRHCMQHVTALKTMCVEARGCA